MIAHVVESLRPVVDEVVVVASEELELPPLDARTVRDREPGLGPLAGIREGLGHVQAELAYVSGTDAPFLTSAFVKAMLSHRCPAAPEVEGHVQTLAAVYPRAALPCAEAMLEAGRMRPLHLLEAMNYHRVPEHDLPDLASVRGFNTPAEYLRAVREAPGRATATLEFTGRSRVAAGRHELEVPIGTLSEVLSHAPADLELLCGTRVAKHFLVSLDGRSFVRDAKIPIGPGEHVIVLDASVGG
jgi:molybdopterin-guanine dinucleotide biosynthesis protein A